VFRARDGKDFNLAYVAADFTKEPSKALDPDYLKAII
jgi:hypothetical protein